MKKKILRLMILSLTIAVVATAVGTFFLASDIKVSGQAKGWRVWVRTEPCSGRFDWLSVAREQQGGGKNFYVPYETVLNAGGKCTRSGPDGCTFAEAKALMEELRGNDKFFDYCCRDYSVWKNIQTGETSVFLVRTGTPGLGWRFEKGDLCCEEAEEIAGKPGACSGGTKGGNTTKGDTHWGATNNNAGLNGTNLTYYRGTTAEQCQADCDKNPKCKAFTLIRAGAYSPNDPPMCYLMSEATDFAPSPCCISAIKNESGGGDKCDCKERCPDCAGLPSLLCEVEGQSAKAKACRQCMSRCEKK